MPPEKMPKKKHIRNAPLEYILEKLLLKCDNWKHRNNVWFILSIWGEREGSKKGGAREERPPTNPSAFFKKIIFVITTSVCPLT